MTKTIRLTFHWNAVFHMNSVVELYVLFSLFHRICKSNEEETYSAILIDKMSSSSLCSQTHYD